MPPIKEKNKKAPKVTVPKPNKEDMADRYERAYNQLFDKLTPDMRIRVLQLSKDSNSKDYEPNKFIRDVIALTESETEL